MTTQAGDSDTTAVAKALGYDLRWIDFGIVSTRELAAQFQRMRGSDDENPEHYRYRAFRRFFREAEVLSDEQIERYLSINATSTEASLKEVLLHELVRFPGLTNGQLRRLSRHPQFRGPDLAHVARRQRLLRHLDSPQLDRRIVNACLAFPDSQVQHGLVKHENVPRWALRFAAEEGMNKAVRNIARARVRRSSSSRLCL